MANETRNAWCIPISNVESAWGELAMPPPYRKTWNITSSGIRANTNGKATTMESIMPVFMSMEFVPAAIPRCSGRTEDMIALMFGKLNMPDPPPIKTM